MSAHGPLGPLVLGIGGTELTEADRRRLLHPLAGMAILFSRNYTGPEQLAQLCGQIHALRDPPLLISVDHEGGRVQRFRTGFTRIPPMAALGALWETNVLSACRVALSTGFVLGSELRARGVDFSFTPVVDLDWGRSAVIGDRALHADPRVVTLLASQLNHGLALAGMANCGKHFPGHGWAVADSHFDLPVDERPLADLLASDCAPYGWLGASLDAVMPAHIVYPDVDERPAGFSPRWVQQILRGQLGFAGAIFSDDLCMAGARAAGDLVQAAQAALGAGCDFVLICNDTAGADRVLDQLQWRRPEHFDERLQRMRPRTPAPTPQGLLHSPRYQLALGHLQALAAPAAG